MNFLKISLMLMLTGIILFGCEEKHKIEIVPDLDATYYSQGQVDNPVNISPAADKLQKKDILNSIKSIIDSKPEAPVTYSLKVGIYINENGTIDKIKDLGSKIFFNDSLVNINRQVTINKLLKTFATTMTNLKFTPAMENGHPVKSRTEVDLNYTANPNGSSVNNNFNVSEPGMNDFIEVDKMPMVKTSVTPQYPELAKRSAVEGVAFVKLLVNKNGVPTKAVVIKSDNEVFNQPSIDAAMKFTFTPAIKDNKQIADWVVIPFRYKLGGTERRQMRYIELPKVKHKK